MPSPLDRAPDENFDEFIGGLNIAEWGGINQHDAPHLIAPSDFQHIENCIPSGTEIAPRGGQSKYHSGNPAGAGYVLWGGYGCVMQHGGIGGVGFADEPAEETPSSFAGTYLMLWA